MKDYDAGAGMTTRFDTMSMWSLDLRDWRKENVGIPQGLGWGERSSLPAALEGPSRWWTLWQACFTPPQPL